MRLSTISTDPAGSGCRCSRTEKGTLSEGPSGRAITWKAACGCVAAVLRIGYRKVMTSNENRDAHVEPVAPHVQQGLLNLLIPAVGGRAARLRKWVR